LITKFSEAHERMRAQLQVRTHRKREAVPTPAQNKKINGIRPVIIDGVTYPSITAAGKALRVGMSRVYKWLRAGKATYA
jgi:hypothetical protein